MKSNYSYVAMRVKQFGDSPSVEIRCVDERSRQVTDCLLIFKTLDDVIYYGAEYFHPLTKAEARNCAIEAIAVGKGKLQIEAAQRISEIESSRLRQASIAKQFREAISGWSHELSSLNWDVQKGLDTPSIKTRIMGLVNSMEKLKPRK